MLSSLSDAAIAPVVNQELLVPAPHATLGAVLIGTFVSIAYVVVHIHSNHG